MTLTFDPIAEARSNWTSRGWEKVDAMSAATSITRAHQIVLSRVNAVLAPIPLNFSRFEVLALLSFSREGELPLGKIGERLQVHPASVTNTIDRLEKDGFVVRLAHPTDGRTTLARLTEAGASAAEAGAVAMASVDFGLTGVTKGALNAVDTGLADVRKAAGDF